MAYFGRYAFTPQCDYCGDGTYPVPSCILDNLEGTRECPKCRVKWPASMWRRESVPQAAGVPYAPLPQARTYVPRARSPRQRIPKALKLNIHWIPPYFRHDWLETYFSPIGSLQDAYITSEPTDFSLGSGMVIFDDSKDADEALRKYSRGVTMFAHDESGAVSNIHQRVVFTVEDAQQSRDLGL